MEHGDLLFKAAKRYNKPLSVMLIDIDHFKQINDTYGHGVGDEVLKQMSASTQMQLREIDLFGRIGGEEFAVVLPEVELEGASESASRICKFLSELEIKVDDITVGVTVSIGVTSFGPGDLSFEEVMKRSDDNLYAAKEGGRNRVVGTSPDA